MKFESKINKEKKDKPSRFKPTLSNLKSVEKSFETARSKIKNKTKINKEDFKVV